MIPEYKDIVILGAGPAGLSLGYELSRRGLDYVILEKGERAGESFNHYPRNIFFGPWMNNTLPGSRVPWSWRLRRATQPAYTWYLGEYARQMGLPICYGTTVDQVRRVARSFVLQTNRGPVACRLLVNATGYYSKPMIPDLPGLDTTKIPVLHSSQYRCADDARRAIQARTGRALVVGQGLSGGETMVELHEAGFEVSLSHRGQLVIGPSVLMESLMSPISWVIERVALKLRLRLNSNPPMAGGKTRHLLEWGLVERYPEIQEVGTRDVVFSDGRRAPFDLLVFCTGYEYAAGHLQEVLRGGPLKLTEDMEVLFCPGLFVLGIDQARTYRSRFLRGIRADARYLAKVLEKRTTPCEQPTFSYEESPFVVDPSEAPQTAGVAG